MSIVSALDPIVGRLSSDVKPAVHAAGQLSVIQLSTDPKVAGRQLQEHVVMQMLPLMRIFALCLTRWRDAVSPREDRGYPEPTSTLALPFVGILSGSKSTMVLDGDYFQQEFAALTSFLPLGALGSQGENSLWAFMQAAAQHSGLSDASDGTSALNEILNIWLTQLTLPLLALIKYNEPSQLPTTSHQDGTLPTKSDTSATRLHRASPGDTDEISRLEVTEAAMRRRALYLSTWAQMLGVRL